MSSRVIRNPGKTDLQVQSSVISGKAEHQHLWECRELGQRLAGRLGTPCALRGRLHCVFSLTDKLGEEMPFAEHRCCWLSMEKGGFCRQSSVRTRAGSGSLACLHAGTPQCKCGDHRKDNKSLLSPSSMGALGIELRSSGLRATTLSC